MLTALMVDDEPLVGRALTRYLGRHGIALDFVTDPDSFRSKVRSGDHRLLALDELLGTTRGSTLCFELRKQGERRGILLTSHLLTESDGAVLAHEHGADAFVEKLPEHILRALERLAVIDPARSPPLAKCRERTSYRNPFTGARVEVDRKRSRIFIENVTCDLTPLECAVFAYLLQRAPNVVTPHELRTEVWQVKSIARSAISNVISRLIDGIPGDWIERVDGCYRARVTY